VFDRTILLWPGIVVAALAALVLVSRPQRRGHFWGFDLLGGIAVAGGGLLIYESQRDAEPDRIGLSDLFLGVFDGWPHALLISIIAAAIVMLAVILLQRALPEWQRALAMTGGVVTMMVVSHLWSAGL
jgi:hypothetical protein